MFSTRLQFAIFAAPQDRAYHLHRTFPPSAGSEVSARRLCAPPLISLPTPLVPVLQRNLLCD